MKLDPLDVRDSCVYGFWGFFILSSGRLGEMEKFSISNSHSLTMNVGSRLTRIWISS